MALTVTEAKAKLSELVNRAAYGHERILIGSRGRAKAALISVDELEILEQALEDIEDARAADEAVAAYERGETIPWEEVREELLRGTDVSTDC